VTRILDVRLVRDRDDRVRVIVEGQRVHLGRTSSFGEALARLSRVLDAPRPSTDLEAAQTIERQLD